ncbi:MAG TPA: ATP-grasp domain-containing protein [Steroidobacteraceae bacterium]|nr:ATP-grasp domain-containing protein [Steroidobacteraceae bacterium]
MLGTPAAAPLRFSRHCKQFIPSAHLIRGESDALLAAEINGVAHELLVEMIIPGDDIAMRTLLASGNFLAFPSFPHPTLPNFDILNNKWTFAALCSELSLPHPSTRLLTDRSLLAQEVQACSPEHALIAKPLNLNGGQGIVVFDGKDTSERLQNISYRPILLQNFIHGRDICATVYARAGHVQTFIGYLIDRKTFIAFHDARIYADVQRLVKHLELDGVYNFDIRVRPDGSLYYLECNPRFFHKMDLSMVAGVNFVALGLHNSHAHPTVMESPIFVRLPLAILRCAPWDLTKRDLKMGAYFMSDPLPYLIEKMRLHLLATGTSSLRCYRPA